jgi:glucose-1-phosphate adenylyltransferase
VISPDARPYWRDVGTIDSYFQASLDLLRAPAAFELADPRWPRNSPFREWLPAVHATAARIEGAVVQGRNLVAAGAEVESPNVVHSILSPRAHVGSGCEVEECVLLPDAEIGEGTRLRRVIVEEGVRVPPGLRIGFGTGDSTDFAVSAGGVTVISQRTFESSRAPRERTLSQIAETLSPPARAETFRRELETTAS